MIGFIALSGNIVRNSILLADQTLREPLLGAGAGRFKLILLIALARDDRCGKRFCSIRFLSAPRFRCCSASRRHPFPAIYVVLRDTNKAVR